MSIKLALLKTLGSTALIGLGALAAKNSAGSTRRRKPGCTPCAVAAMNDKARQAVKTGRLSR